MEYSRFSIFSDSVGPFCIEPSTSHVHFNINFLFYILGLSLGFWIVLVIRDFVIQGFVISGLCSRSMHLIVNLDGLNNTIHCSGEFLITRVFVTIQTYIHHFNSEMYSSTQSMTKFVQNQTLRDCVLCQHNLCANFGIISVLHVGMINSLNTRWRFNHLSEFHTKIHVVSSLVVALLWIRSSKLHKSL